MSTTNFLEKLAMEVHYSKLSDSLIQEQSLEIKNAIYTNNSAIIHNQFLDVGYLAHGTTAVEI